ncbi:hypothetical protein PR048_006208, partial [Dryococelus australis]
MKESNGTMWRKVLSSAQKVFHPIGFLCPATLAPKIFIQESWNLKGVWDDPLPEDVQKRFKRWETEVLRPQRMKIPRCLTADGDCVFSAVPVKAPVSTEGNITVCLVVAKTRVSPFKNISMPMLELLGCSIGSRLAASVRESLTLKIPEFIWTDSSPIEKAWVVFVSNLVKEIRTLTKHEDWHNVPRELIYLHDAALRNSLVFGCSLHHEEDPNENRTNVIGEDNGFHSLDWFKIEEESCSQRIQWKLIPPTAAWCGGWGECIVQMVNKLLRRMLGRASLRYEEVSTILREVESVINSRPLTYLSEDTKYLVPLTPAMFLQDNRPIGVPDIDNLEETYLYARLQEDLRRRFREEYLGLLVQQKNETNNLKALKIGDIVLISTDNKRRLEWPTRRNLEMYPGKDGHVQVTSGRAMTRPVSHICPSEMSTSQEPPSAAETVGKGILWDLH